MLNISDLAENRSYTLSMPLEQKSGLPSETCDADDYDKLRRRVLWKMPYGLYLVGSRDGERVNAMTLNWASQVAFDPKLVGIGVEKDAYTHELIESGEVFSLNVIARDDRAIVRKFVKPVEVDTAASTLNGFAFLTAKTGAPILAQAVAYTDCSLYDRIECGNHTFFVGEVVEAGFLQDEDTEVLRMQDTRMNYGG